MPNCPLPTASDTLANHTHPTAETESFPCDDHGHSPGHSSPGHGTESSSLGFAASTHAHVHDPESLRRIINRLARIEGHIRGIKTMLQESRPCPDVLVQIAAVRGALDRVARIVLDEHLSECVSRAAEEGNIDEEIKQLKAALDRFLP